MFAAERQHAIVERARREGRVDVAGLAGEFDVTPETVRRDLATLERRGVLRRTHGGAVPVERVALDSHEPWVSERDHLQEAEKERVARAALAEIPQEGTVLLDAGTSTLRLARLLPTAGRELTVVTNCLPIAALLVEHRCLTVHLIGGRLRDRTLAAVDAWAERVLREVTVDVAVIGTNGVSVRRGLTTPDVTEAEVKRAMVAAGRRVVVLADHSKFGADAFARFASLDEVDVVVTDTGLDIEAAAEIGAAGPRVVRA